MGRVFVVQKGRGLDFSKAERFGKVDGIVFRDVFPDDWEQRVQAVRGIITSRLQDFSFEDDYILLTGDPVIIGLVFSFLTARASDMVRAFVHCLKWDREAGDYFPVLVPLF